MIYSQSKFVGQIYWDLHQMKIFQTGDAKNLCRNAFWNIKFVPLPNVPFASTLQKKKKNVYWNDMFLKKLHQ